MEAIKGRLKKIDFNYSKSYWKYFFKLEDSDQCVCCLCGNKYKCCSSNGKAIKSHLINSHQYTDPVTNKINNNEISSSLFKCLTYDGIPTTLLDSASFRNFCHLLKYECPRRYHYTNYLEGIFKEVNVYKSYIY